MPWVRLDDGYPEHPKVDKVGPIAAWLNVCAWAYCARNLTDGFVPAERVPRLANIGKVGAHVQALLDVRLWEAAEGGYNVHDYLVYNPSREQVLRERAATAKRAAAYRERVSNGVTPPDTNGPGSGVGNEPTNSVSNGVSTNAPYPSRSRLTPGENEIPPTPSLRSGGAPPKPRGNPRVQATIDAFRERGLGHVVFAKRDKGEVAGANADPGLLAEVYEAVESGAYGDEFMRKNLSVHAAVGWVNGYLASQPRAPAPPTSLSVVPSDGHANTFCQPCSDAGRRPHPPGHPGCVATAFRESA